MNGKGRDTDRDWQRIAESDPFWGVLSNEEYRKGEIDENRMAAFMASGETYVGDLLAFIRKYLVPDFKPKRVLDVGCGVGRLAIPFARQSAETVGVDVAPAMLELCGKLAADAGVSNLVLVQGDDDLSGAKGKFDLVNTYIVLQHVPPERGYQVVRAMLDRLAPGGVASIQTTFAKARSFLVHEQQKARFYRREGNCIVDIVDTRWSPPVGTINMYDYDMNQLMAEYSLVAGQPMLCLPTNDDSHLGVHCIFQKARER